MVTWNYLSDALRASLLGFVAVGLVLILLASGCAVNTSKEQAEGQKSDNIQAPAAALPSPQSLLKKETPLQYSLKLQELSVREELGQTIVNLGFSQPVNQYRHFPLPQPARVVVDIPREGNGPSFSENFHLQTHWAGTLRLISSPSNVRLIVDIAAANVPAYSIIPDHGGLKLTIGSLGSTATTRKQVTLVKGGVRTDIGTAGVMPSATNQKPSQTPFGGPTTSEITSKYTGEKISLEFKDADIKNIFRLLAEVSGRNIMVTDDVSRKVTVRLVEVPWDQAMDLIIDTNGLGKEEIGNVIRVSTAARLKSERDALAAATKSQEGLEPLQTAYLTLNYAKVVKGPTDSTTDKDLVERVKALLTPRGRVEADQRTNTLIVRDIKTSIEDIQNLVGRLDTRTPQVLIESNLIETTPTFSRALGIQMETFFNKGRVQSSTRFRADQPFNEAALTFFENATASFTPASGFSFMYFGNNVASLLSAAEAEGNIKIISRPSVVTLNNVESQIESANIVRVRTSAATVGEAGALREIRAGITLRVTPQVSADGFVLLNITAKSSTLDFSRTVDGIPQENTREAKANVLVRDGETVVIGGIMKDTSSNSDTGVPYLKNIPVFGWLFRKASWQKDFEELVVFITPRIIAAGSEDLPRADQLWRDKLKQTTGDAFSSSFKEP